MNKNIVIILLIVGCLVGCYFWLNKEDDYKKQIEKLEKKRDSIDMVIARLKYEYDELEKQKVQIRYKYKETETKLNNQQNETDAIPGIVATYSNRKLDSILTNYRFEPRAKSRNSNRP